MSSPFTRAESAAPEAPASAIDRIKQLRADGALNTVADLTAAGLTVAELTASGLTVAELTDLFPPQESEK